MSKLEQKFAEIVHDPPLKPLLQVIQGLMRFLPSSRIPVDEALDLMGNTQAVCALSPRKHQTHSQRQRHLFPGVDACYEWRFHGWNS